MKIKKTVVTTASNKTSKPSKSVASQPVSAPPKKGKASVPAAASSAPEPAVKSGINRGVKTGMPVMKFQDMTLARNDGPKFQLTDTELAALWREEFPNSRAVLAGRIDEAIVRGVRNLFNQGTGGHGTPGQTQSSKPYVIENGKRVVSEYTRARKAQAEDEDEDVAPTAPKGKASVPAKASASKPVVKGKSAKAVPAANQPAAAKPVVKGKTVRKAA